jgi:hypothetical protein
MTSTLLWWRGTRIPVRTAAVGCPAGTGGSHREGTTTARNRNTTIDNGACNGVRPDYLTLWSNSILVDEPAPVRPCFH